MEKTKTGLFSKLARAVAGRSTVDADVLDDLEEVLISSDVGVETTVKIIERIEARVARDKYMNTSELQSILRDEIAQERRALPWTRVDKRYTAVVEGELKPAASAETMSSPAFRRA